MADLTTSAPSDLDDDAEPVEPVEPDGSAEGGRPFWIELPGLILIALVLALLLKTFVVQAFYIPSSSMEPTLEIGDRVLVTKMAYAFREPIRGEVVVFTETEQDPDASGVERAVQSLVSGLGFSGTTDRDFIKRIIGLPGDTVELRDGVVFVNGEELPEAPTEEGGYLSRFDGSDFGPVTVEDEHYFMLGDNRPNSADSRYGLGQIHRDQILGRAFVTIWPVGSAGSLAVGEY